MSRKDKLTKIIREEWPAKLDSELKARFRVEFETRWNIMHEPNGAFETFRTDREQLTDEMYSFIHGYMTAMNHVYIWNGRA